MRRVVSIWLPDWPIERLRQVSPRAVPCDRAFVLVETQGSSGLVVTALNAMARREGLQAGMALADARAVLPGLLSAPARIDADRKGLQRLAQWCGRYGPSRNVDGEDGIWIDVTGIATFYARCQPGGAGRAGSCELDEERALLAGMAARLRGFGLTPRIGLADGLGAAHALARFGGGGEDGAGEASVIALPGDSRAALAGLPVEGLRLAPEAVLLLKRLGLRRIGQLYGIARPALERRFRDVSRRTAKASVGAASAAVVLQLDQALGIRNETRAGLAEPPVHLARLAYAEPLISSEGLISAIGDLADALACDLAAAHQGARRLRLSLYRVDGTCAQVLIGTSSASRAPAHFMRLLKEKLGAIDAGFGIDVLSLEALHVEALRERQEDMAAGIGCDAGKAEGAPAAALIDQLCNRLGAAAVYSLRPRESHIPERAQIAQPLLANRPPPRSRELQNYKAGPPRPPLLLPVPEPITVMAEVPEGAPARFIWRRLNRRVMRAQGPERIAPEWWRALRGPSADRLVSETDEKSSRPAAGINLGPQRPRDYYRLEDDSGGRYWVFREGLYQTAREDGPPSWYMHGLFA